MRIDIELLLRKSYNLIKLYASENNTADMVTKNISGDLLAELNIAINEFENDKNESKVMEKQINKLQHYAIENGFNFEGFDNIADVVINQLEKESEG